MNLHTKEANEVDFPFISPYDYLRETPNWYFPICFYVQDRDKVPLITRNSAYKYIFFKLTSQFIQCYFFIELHSI